MRDKLKAFMAQRTFAQVVRAWRRKRRLARVDAARELAVPLRTLEDWEYGKRTPRGIARQLIINRLKSPPAHRHPSAAAMSRPRTTKRTARS